MSSGCDSDVPQNASISATLSVVGEESDYQSKSPSAGRMGKATEYLVAATCILTRGAS